MLSAKWKTKDFKKVTKANVATDQDSTLDLIQSQSEDDIAALILTCSTLKSTTDNLSELINNLQHRIEELEVEVAQLKIQAHIASTEDSDSELSFNNGEDVSSAQPTSAEQRQFSSNNSPVTSQNSPGRPVPQGLHSQSPHSANGMLSALFADADTIPSPPNNELPQSNLQLCLTTQTPYIPSCWIQILTYGQKKTFQEMGSYQDKMPHKS